MEQLAGPVAQQNYKKGDPYPEITTSGYVASYSHQSATVSQSNGGRPETVTIEPVLQDIMNCFTPDQLPVLHQLAREFVVCDRWFSSMPGPTWPNRMFAHAASSAGLDDSPTWEGTRTVWYELAPGEGAKLPNGTIFDALRRGGLKYRIYAGDRCPLVAALHGISRWSTHRFEDLKDDLGKDDFGSISYAFIEPSYDAPSWRDGSSQHPPADVNAGEAFIKATYEAIRSSPVWNDSLLIITWDEHGGFYDHVPPPEGVPPNDPKPEDDFNQHGFRFDRLGPRVPAVIISPRIPKNQIDHRVYDHASIPATIERLFGLAPLTERDKAVNAVDGLVSLATPRTDTPAKLDSPSTAAIPKLAAAALGSPPPDAGVDETHLGMFLASALSQHLRAEPGQRAAILARAKAIRTHADALSYLKEVDRLVRADSKRSGARPSGSGPSVTTHPDGE
jgi:phospholipase C